MIFLVALVLGLPIAFVLRSALDDGWREVAFLDTLEREDVIYVPAANVFLVDADPPIALKAVSTHLGTEPVAYCPSASTFHELGHGSLWDRLGHYMEGPATRGLDRVALRIRSDSIEINVSAVTRGAERYSVQPLAPSGMFCSYEQPEDARAGFLSPP
jgi:hypothetical protein